MYTYVHVGLTKSVSYKEFHSLSVLEIILFFSGLTKKTVLLMQMLGKFSTQQIHTSYLPHLSVLQYT